jgi:hypothetical protein
LRNNGDGTITDRRTRLVWTKSADLAGDGVDLKLAEAFIAKFNAAKTLGGSDWRLPTREELLKLVDPARRRPALPVGHPFTGVSGWYRVSQKGWGVDLDTGVPWGTGKSMAKKARLWLVRGGR